VLQEMQVRRIWRGAIHFVVLQGCYEIFFNQNWYARMGTLGSWFVCVGCLLFPWWKRSKKSSRPKIWPACLPGSLWACNANAHQALEFSL